MAKTKDPIVKIRNLSSAEIESLVQGIVTTCMKTIDNRLGRRVCSENFPYELDNMLKQEIKKCKSGVPRQMKN